MQMGLVGQPWGRTEKGCLLEAGCNQRAKSLENRTMKGKSVLWAERQSASRIPDRSSLGFGVSHLWFSFFPFPDYSQMAVPLHDHWACFSSSGRGDAPAWNFSLLRERQQRFQLHVSGFAISRISRRRLTAQSRGLQLMPQIPLVTTPVDSVCLSTSLAVTLCGAQTKAYELQRSLTVLEFW